MSNSTCTTILIRKQTRQFLREIGKKGQTYDKVISDLAERAGLKAIKEVKNTLE